MKYFDIFDKSILYLNRKNTLEASMWRNVYYDVMPLLVLTLNVVKISY